MELLVAWKESLSLLKPKNLKLLMMVSYNAITKANEIFLQEGSSLSHRMKVGAILGAIVGVLFSVYRFLILPYIIVPSVVFYVESLSRYCGGMHEVVRYSAVLYFVVYIWCYLIHSSVHRKSIRDFFSVKNFLVYVVSSALFYSIAMPFVCYIGSTMFFPTPGYGHVSSGIGRIVWLSSFFIIPSICLMWSVLTVLFGLDSHGSLKSLFCSVIRSAKMILYNFPGFMIIMNGLVIVWCIGMVLCGGLFGRWWFPGGSAGFVAVHDVIINGILFGISVGFVIPFIVSVISNLYIKQLYDHKERYI